MNIIYNRKIHEKAFLGPQFFFEKKNGPVSRSHSSESEDFFDIHRASFALKPPQLEPGKRGFFAYISRQNGSK